MALLLGLMLAAAASAAPAAAPAPSGAAPVAEPLKIAACTPARKTCRHVDSFGMVVSPTEAVTVKVDKDLEFTAAGNLGLMLGESVVFKIDKGVMTLVSNGKAADAPLSPLIDRALGKAAPSVESIKPPAGEIRISLRQAPGRPDVFLFVENGYADQGLTYQANIISVNNAELATEVCPAGAGKIDVESWPYAFPSVRLSGFKQVDKAAASC